MMDRVDELLRENQVLKDALAACVSGPIWIDLRQAAKLYGCGISTLRQWCAEGRIDPRCGIKQGGKWRFRRKVIMTEGILLR